MHSFSWYRLAFVFAFAAFSAALFLFSFGMISAHEGTVQTIRITADGYEPATLEILQGDTVEFVNENTKKHWPASNIHPTHTVYPGSNISKCGTDEEAHIFDACRGLSEGETYRFTFTEVGRWRFHDHIFPQMTGVITVLEDPDFVHTEVEVKKEQGAWSRFWSTVSSFFSNVLNRIFPERVDKRLSHIRIFDIADDTDELRKVISFAGSRRVMDKLLAEAGGGSELDCHQEAHQVGRVSYEVLGAEVFEEGDPSCHSGFYHGAMEAFLSEEGTSNLAENITELCAAFGTRFGVFECLHGVGHGVMAYEDYDLFISLDLCDELGDDFSASSCYGGVFMENIITAQGLGAVPGHETEWVSTADPHFPCSLFEEGSSREFACYQMQTSWMLTLSNYDFGFVREQCESSRESSKIPCFISLGRDAAGFSLRDPQKILEICNTVSREGSYYASCIYGGLNVIIDFWGAKLKNQGDEFCSLVKDVDAQASCFHTLDQRKADIFGGQ